MSRKIQIRSKFNHPKNAMKKFLRTLPVIGATLVLMTTAAHATVIYAWNGRTDNMFQDANWTVAGSNVTTAPGNTSADSIGNPVISNAVINFDATTGTRTFDYCSMTTGNWTFNLSGGTMNTGNANTWTLGSGTMNISGGVWNLAQGVTQQTGGIINMTAGTVTIQKNQRIGSGATLNISGGAYQNNRIIDIQSGGTLVVSGSISGITANATVGVVSQGAFWSEAGSTLKFVLGPTGVSKINITNISSGPTNSFTLAGALQVDLSNLSLSADGAMHSYLLIDGSTVAKFGAGVFSGETITLGGNMVNADWSFDPNSIIQTNSGAYKTVYLDVLATTAPEPQTWVMLLSGFGVLLGIQRLRLNRVGTR